ncbi:MAG: hypothetical protein HY854_20195 [Burkholderiales bacterium]|nr:hypothetical protein [Burkholderiales bacterium]
MIRILLLAALLAGATPAQAHLMPAQQGTIHVVGDVAYVLVSLPVSALGGDDNRDGLLSVQELQRHYVTLRQRAIQGFRITDAGLPAEAQMLQLLADADPAHAQGERHVVLMARFKFAQPPTALRVETDLFGSRDDERRLAIKARRGADVEPVELTPRRPGRGLFRSPWQVMQDSVRVAVQAITPTRSPPP